MELAEGPVLSLEGQGVVGWKRGVRQMGSAGWGTDEARTEIDAKSMKGEMGWPSL